MTETAEAPRVLTVDPTNNWSGALKKHFRLREIDHEQAKDVDDAIELLNSGDFTAVITDGLKGEWRTMVDEADRLEIRSILISNSAMAVHKAQTEGVVAFHARDTSTNGGMDRIKRAAIGPDR